MNKKGSLNIYKCLLNLILNLISDNNKTHDDEWKMKEK